MFPMSCWSKTIGCLVSALTVVVAVVGADVLVLAVFVGLVLFVVVVSSTCFNDFVPMLNMIR